MAAEAEDQLYGLVREALANTVKHARATAVAIDVSATDRVVAIEVRDDGCGFTPAAAGAGSYGLLSMHSRATELGGKLTITSAPGRGTAVHVEVPGARTTASGLTPDAPGGKPPAMRSVQLRVVSESMATVIARMSGASSPAATSTP